MKNRRSFLKMLGLSAVAAPATVQALQAEAVPVSAVAAFTERRIDWRDLQREINLRNSEILESMNDYDRDHHVWLDWAKKATARG